MSTNENFQNVVAEVSRIGRFHYLYLLRPFWAPSEALLRHPPTGYVTTGSHGVSKFPSQQKICQRNSRKSQNIKMKQNTNLCQQEKETPAGSIMTNMNLPFCLNIWKCKWSVTWRTFDINERQTWLFFDSAHRILKIPVLTL